MAGLINSNELEYGRATWQLLRPIRGRAAEARIYEFLRLHLMIVISLSSSQRYGPYQDIVKLLLFIYF